MSVFITFEETSLEVRCALVRAAEASRGGRSEFLRVLNEICDLHRNLNDDNLLPRPSRDYADMAGELYRYWTTDDDVTAVRRKLPAWAAEAKSRYIYDEALGGARREERTSRGSTTAALAVTSLGLVAADKMLPGAPTIGVIDAALESKEWRTLPRSWEYTSAPALFNTLRARHWMVFDFRTLRMAWEVGPALTTLENSLRDAKVMQASLALERGKLDKLQKKVDRQEAEAEKMIAASRDAVAKLKTMEKKERRRLRKNSPSASAAAAAATAVQAIGGKEESNRIAAELAPLTAEIAAVRDAERTRAALCLRSSLARGDADAVFDVLCEASQDEVKLACRNIGSAVSRVGASNVVGDAAIFALIQGACGEEDDSEASDDSDELMGQLEAMMAGGDSPAQISGGGGRERDRAFGTKLGAALNAGSDDVNAAGVVMAAARVATDLGTSLFIGGGTKLLRTAEQLMKEEMAEQVRRLIDEGSHVFHGAASEVAWNSRYQAAFQPAADALGLSRFFPTYEKLNAAFLEKHAAYAAAIETNGGAACIEPRMAVEMALKRQGQVIKRARFGQHARRAYARLEFEGATWFFNEPDDLAALTANQDAGGDGDGGDGAESSNRDAAARSAASASQVDAAGAHRSSAAKEDGIGDDSDDEDDRESIKALLRSWNLPFISTDQDDDDDVESLPRDAVAQSASASTADAEAALRRSTANRDGDSDDTDGADEGDRGGGIEGLLRPTTCAAKVSDVPLGEQQRSTTCCEARCAIPSLGEVLAATTCADDSTVSHSMQDATLASVQMVMIVPLPATTQSKKKKARFSRGGEQIGPHATTADGELAVKVYFNSFFPHMKVLLSNKDAMRSTPPIPLANGFHKLEAAFLFESIVRWREQPSPLDGLTTLYIDLVESLGAGMQSKVGTALRIWEFGSAKSDLKKGTDAHFENAPSTHEWLDANRVVVTIANVPLKAMKDALIAFNSKLFIPSFFESMRANRVVPAPSTGEIKKVHDRRAKMLKEKGERRDTPVAAAQRNGKRDNLDEVICKLNLETSVTSGGFLDCPCAAHCACGRISFIGPRGVTRVRSIESTEFNCNDEEHFICHAVDGPDEAPTTRRRSASSASSGAGQSTRRLKQVAAPAGWSAKMPEDDLDLLRKHGDVHRLSLLFFIDAAIAFAGKNHRDAVMHSHFATMILEADLGRRFHALIDTLLYEGSSPGGAFARRVPPRAAAVLVVIKTFQLTSLFPSLLPVLLPSHLDQGGDGLDDTRAAFDTFGLVGKLKRLEAETLARPIEFEGQKYYISVDFVPIDGAALRYLLAHDKGNKWIRPDPHNGLHRILLTAVDPITGHLAFRAPITLTATAAGKLREDARAGGKGSDAWQRARRVGVVHASGIHEPILQKGGAFAFTEVFHSVATTQRGLLQSLAVLVQ